jgi:hypothetical protein
MAASCGGRVDDRRAKRRQKSRSCRRSPRPDLHFAACRVRSAGGRHGSRLKRIQDDASSSCRSARSPGQKSCSGRSHGGRVVNFDRIYNEIFAPAIGARSLEGQPGPVPHGHEPGRSQHRCLMFRGINYARSGGHQPQSERLLRTGVAAIERSGTAIFRQSKRPPPSTSATSKPSPTRRPAAHAGWPGRRYSRLDDLSPIQMAADQQRNQPQAVEDLLKEAEESIRRWIR